MQLCRILEMTFVRGLVVLGQRKPVGTNAKLTSPFQANLTKGDLTHDQAVNNYST